MIPRGVELSSKNIRKQQTTCGTMLVSAMRDSFLAECAMFNAGGIRYVTLELLDGNLCVYMSAHYHAFQGQQGLPAGPAVLYV